MGHLIYTNGNLIYINGTPLLLVRYFVYKWDASFMKHFIHKWDLSFRGETLYL